MLGWVWINPVLQCVNCLHSRGWKGGVVPTLPAMLLEGFALPWRWKYLSLKESGCWRWKDSDSQWQTAFPWITWAGRSHGCILTFLWACPSSLAQGGCMCSGVPSVMPQGWDGLHPVTRVTKQMITFLFHSLDYWINPAAGYLWIFCLWVFAARLSPLGNGLVPVIHRSWSQQERTFLVISVGKGALKTAHL